jgi:hypothetical protein
MICKAKVQEHEKNGNWNNYQTICLGLLKLKKRQNMSLEEKGGGDDHLIREEKTRLPITFT